jgi:hypothetical protein
LISSKDTVDKTLIFIYIDPPSTSAAITNSWGHDIFPHGETNSFFESVKLASSGEINWNDIDVKPYCGKIIFFCLIIF